MKNKIKDYVDNLFKGVKENRQLRELKEEISANLLEKLNDYITSGINEETAFLNAVESLGDMSELVDSLEKISNEKYVSMNTTQMDKLHIFGYIIATGVLLFGVLTALMLYFLQEDLYISVATLLPFAVASIPTLVFLGLTQENEYTYGMKKGRALLYALSTGILVFGILTVGITYFKSKEEYMIFATAIPFVIVSLSLFIYLGLTEKSRVKMNDNWKNKWINYYKDAQSMQVRGLFSGALWLFSIGIFVLLCFVWKWYYAWIIFIFTIGCEVLLEMYFVTKYKK